jgi:hypothetical protein
LERFPFVEFGFVNAGKIGDSKVLSLNIHVWPPLLKSYHHRFHSRIKATNQQVGGRVTPCALPFPPLRRATINPLSDNLSGGLSLSV